ncbi:hypothetical protein NBRC116493_30010 [Aurantivibrio infirmus]
MIKDVEESDLLGISSLLKGLGYSTSLSMLESRLDAYKTGNEYKVMIDMEDVSIKGIIGLHVYCPFHTKGTIGRITTFIVEESYRGNRAGTMLVEAADAFFKESGCLTTEVTSSIMRSVARKILLNAGYKAGEAHYVKKIS